MTFPDHIIQKSDTWYFNTKSGKFIHRDNIERVVANYNKSVDMRSGAKKESIKYKKNFKMAQRRWEDD